MKFTTTLWSTLFTFSIAFANGGKDTLHINRHTQEPPKELAAPPTRSFKELDQKLATRYSQYTLRESEFTDEYIAGRFATDSTLAEFLAPAVGTFEALDESGNYVDVLTPADLVTLPVGIRQTIGGVQYFLGISSARFTPEYAELTAFMRIVLPQSDGAGGQRQLFLGATGVRLSHKGGLMGEPKLTLLGDVPIKIGGGNGLVILKGGMNMATGAVQELTYASIDCNGFKELAIRADVEFPRSMMEPVTNELEVIPDPAVRVRGNFQTVVSDWNDILVELSLPKFQLTNFKGTIFELSTAVFDFSDLRNSSNVLWPQGYQQYLIPGNENLWRGVYVNSLKVILPKEFKKKNSEERISFQAQHLLIDGMGVSGTFSVNNLLPLDEGAASGWHFSVTQLQASFVANQVVSAGFGGGIVLPVSKNNPNNSAVIQYNAVFNPQNDEYTLTASLPDTIPFSLFSAQGKLYKNSRIELKVKDHAFRPKAILHGELAIGANNGTTTSSSGDKTVDFKGILFQNLQLQTESPYFMADYFGYQGDVIKFANFPVTISNIGLIATPTQAALAFDIAVNLMKDQFNAQTRIAVIGSFSQEGGIQEWKYDRLKLERITVDADFSGIAFDGTLILMENDPVYGKGFKAHANVAFKALGNGNVKMTANAIFGKTDFRYWYIDALVNNLNISVGAAFTIKGFGGGAFYHMKKTGFGADFSVDVTDSAPTGAQYTPDDKSGLGVKAMVLFSNQVNASVFNGGAGFEMAFNTNGGINRISIFGEAHIMKEFHLPGAEKIIEKLQGIQNAETNFSPDVLERMKNSNLIDVSKTVYPSNIQGEAGINAYAAIEYDFQQRTLHGSFDLYIDVAGGLFRGRASGNRAGWAVVHFAPDKWYIHMGTPTDRLGLKVGIGSFSVQAGGYFMVGDEIPGSPPPPSVVANILGLDAESLNYMRDENALGSGRGMAFGADFSLDTGDIRFLIFYARFQAGAGFDIMVKDYGEAECKGSGQIGINGWYANGQAYAYLQGELGIRIKIGFVRKKIPIIKAGAAVLLQAKLPNPAWFRGYLGGNYSLLGGLVRGKFRFKIELGDQCELVNGGPLDGIKIIADVSPADNTSDVDVFAIPQAAFNMALESPFTLEDDDGKVKSYKIKLEEFTLYDANNQVIPATLQWNGNKDLAGIRSVDILPPTSSLRAKVKVSFLENQGGVWQPIYENGVQAIEEKEVRFTTGAAPDYIPVSNIVYAYPLFDQTYFYPQEYPNGYVKLDRGQPYLFQLQQGWRQESVYTDPNNAVLKGNISYDSGNRLVRFSLPSLGNQKSYRLSLITVPPTTAGANTSQTYAGQNLEREGNTAEIRNTEITSVAQTGETVTMLEYAFKTSQHNTFTDKMNQKALVNGLREIIYSDVHALRAEVSNSEKFSKEELSGALYSQNKPLVTVEAILDDAYFTSEIRPLIYAEYPLDGNLTVTRSTSAMGLPPVKAIEKLTWYETYLEESPSNSYLFTRMPFRYHLPYYYKQDFIDLQYKIVNRYLQNPGSYQSKIQQYNYIINGIFPYIKPGNYKVKYQYTLPGDVPGTSKVFTYTNPQ